MWLYDNSTGCEFPKGSQKTIATLSAVWMAGYDQTNSLKVAAQTYRSGGTTDYWPGPIDSIPQTLSQRHAISQTWAKIWKINSVDINAFLQLSTHTIANTPASILEWPAKGNSYAKGASGTSLTITRDMAPFVDVNADGVYNPLAGDHPKMKGSQMLWWIINDATDAHTVALTNELKMEIRMSAYAYNAGTVLDNIIFYEYEVTNRSATNYSSYRLGVLADFDLGQPFDDMTGFNEQQRMAFTYNSNSTPFPAAIGGLVWVEQPGDTYNSYAPLGSYKTYNNGSGSDGDPKNGPEFNHLMNSRNRAGQPYPNGSAYGSTNERQECDDLVSVGDRRVVLATKDYQFQPGQTMKFATALVAADSMESCPAVDFTRLHETADTAYSLYWHPRQMTIDPPVNPSGIATMTRSELRMFPNPAMNRLFVEIGDQAHGMLNVYDALGRSVALLQSRTAKGFELNTFMLSAGVYSVRHQNNSATGTGIFVKE